MMQHLALPLRCSASGARGSTTCMLTGAAAYLLGLVMAGARPRHVDGTDPCRSGLFFDLVFVGVAFQLGAPSRPISPHLASASTSTPSHPIVRSSPLPSALSPFPPAIPPLPSRGAFFNYSFFYRCSASHPCRGLLETLLWSAAIFVSMLRIWSTEVAYRGRLVATSRLHRLLDLATYFLLFVAASNIRPLQETARGGGERGREEGPRGAERRQGPRRPSSSLAAAGLAGRRCGGQHEAHRMLWPDHARPGAGRGGDG